MRKALIFDGDAVQVLAVHKNLIRLGIRVYTGSRSKFSYGYLLQNSKNYIIPDFNHKLKLKESLVSIIINNQIDYLIPLNDPSAEVIINNYEEFLKIVKFNLVEPNIFYRAFDKLSLMKLCEKINVPHPKTQSIDEYKKNPNNTFPLIVKPNRSSGARGFKMINNKNDLRELDKLDEKNHIQQYINPQGNQYKAQLFVDRDSNLINSTVILKKRYFPIKNGSSTFCYNITNEEIIKQCTKILKELNWIGFADFDLIHDIKKDEFKIIEINPRIPACIGVSLESGIDFIKNKIELMNNSPLTKFKSQKKIFYRYLTLDSLHFITKKDYQNLIKELFKLNYKYQDLYKGQLLSFIFGTLGNFFKLFNKEFKQTKNFVQ